MNTFNSSTYASRDGVSAAQRADLENSNCWSIGIPAVTKDTEVLEPFHEFLTAVAASVFVLSCQTGCLVCFKTAEGCDLCVELGD